MKYRNAVWGAIFSLLIMGSAMFAGVTLSGCLDSGDRDGDLDLVMVTIDPQKEMVASIAGEDIEVVVMVPEGQSPHDYSPTPNQLLKAARADMYLKVGSGVEFEELHLGTLMDQNPDMEIVDLSEGIDLKGSEEHYGTGEDSGEHDHEGGIDPHIWLSPSNLLTMAENVRDAFMERDPERNYSSRYEDYRERLSSTYSEMSSILESYKDRKFLTYHPSWGYFADDFHLIQTTIEESGKAPGPQGVANIIEQAQENDIKVIFVEPQFDSSKAEQIADAVNGRVVSVDPLAEDLLDNLLYVAHAMADGFEEGSG
ncbi:MAG: zinc ABC transporter substrate-binding protein [Thermoplasmatota archaeon]